MILENKIKLYKYLISNPITSQRKLAEYLNMSTGTINNLIKSGIANKEIIIREISYRKKEYIVTNKGEKICNITGHIKTAVILAAGEETEFDYPRSFLDIGGVQLLERHIKLLRANNIDNIYVIVGEAVEQYKKLEQKYGVIIIQNHVYQSTGTLYSLSLIRDSFMEDFLLLAGDLVYEDLALKFILSNNSVNSTIISELSNRSDSVYVNIENTNLTRISKDIYSLGNISGEFIGISKISYPFFKDMMLVMEKSSNSLYYYEYALEKVAIFQKMKCLIIPDLLWSEIDNKKQFNLAKKIYKKIHKKEAQNRF